LEGGTDGLRKPDARGRVPFIGAFYGYAFPYGPYGRSNSVEETDYGLVTQWDGYVPTDAAWHHWAAGAEWNRNENTQASSGYDNCPAALRPNPPMGPRNCEFLHTNQSDMPDAKGTQWAAWVQDEISWAE